MRAACLWRVALAAGLILGGAAPSLQAFRVVKREVRPWQERGADVGMALLVTYYKELPQRKHGEKPSEWAERLQGGLNEFKKKVAARYTEGTLQRLLECPHTVARRAAVLALGLTGTIRSNQAVAGMLYDEDGKVRQFASDGLWLLWFRADKPENNRELQRLMRLANDKKGDPEKALAGLNLLIKKAPRFAEAYNQRAILHYRAEAFDKAVADCEVVLKLNPYHFGAASGLARSYLELKKPRAALKAYRAALRINPGMGEVAQAIRFLENVLGEEGKK
jgi:tetratricopeptide (TPR) repeat protein